MLNRISWRLERSERDRVVCALNLSLRHTQGKVRVEKGDSSFVRPFMREGGSQIIF